MTAATSRIDSKRLASAGGSGASKPRDALWLWDVETRKKTIVDCPSTPNGIAFSPNGKRIAAINGRYSSGPFLTICDMPSGRQFATVNRLDDDDNAVAFSPNSKLIALGSREGIVELLDAAKGKVVMSFDDLQARISSVAFHPKQNLLAATGADKTIRIWDLGSKKLVSTTKLSAGDYSLRLHFSSDGTQLATCDQLGKFRVRSQSLATLGYGMQRLRRKE